MVALLEDTLVCLHPRFFGPSAALLRLILSLKHKRFFYRKVPLAVVLNGLAPSDPPLLEAPPLFWFCFLYGKGIIWSFGVGKAEK
ncbi:MAG TPA: hypothetical protein DCS88_14615 [Alphaproteobacteria bacterium]|nr:hypothetical protein [Alphaproteobacteria bacterium]